MGISGFLSEALFALAHWVFAYKYWILSYKIEMIVEGGPEKELSCQSKTNFCLLLNLFLWGTVSLVLFYLLALTNLYQYKSLVYIFYITLWSTLIVDSLSCWVLYDSFKRISKYSSKAKL